MDLSGPGIDVKLKERKKESLGSRRVGSICRLLTLAFQVETRRI
jgi:hypothetical protein